MAQTLKYVIGKDYRPLTVLEAKGGNTFSPDYDKENWVQARQYEDSLRQVFVEITNEDGSAYDLTGANVLFEGILPDNEHKILDNSHVVFYEDPTTGKFRFDMPAQAFSVAGQYKQAFFRVVKDYRNIATLEFKFEVLADMVVTGMVARDYISPLEDLFNTIKEAETKNVAELKKIVDDKIDEITDLMTTLNQTNTATLGELNTAKTGLEALEDKIKQDGLFTQGEAEGLKQSIQEQIDELAKLGFEKEREDNNIAQQTRSLYSYAAEGLEKRNALASNVLRVGTLNLALAGALNIGIDVGDFWSETDKASRRLTENQMAMDWMGCNIIGCQEVISSMLSGAYNSYNRAMAEDQMYPNLYVGLSPEINHQLQTLNGMREGNALFADRQMSYVALAAYSSDPNRSYLAYRTTFNNKNVLVVVTHNNVNDESEFEELATFCAQQVFDTCIILADTNNDPDSQCIAKLLAAGFDIVSKKDDNTMITEPAYSGHQMQIFYKGCVLQKKELYDVTTFNGSDHKAIVAEFKVGD
ncbi:BppU family phage baseplate upper protein [Ligilactobacillus salivarius]|uniref:BppU family phage baseplate upper protein n=1 Tax=Ligilactobacillus salivarius TaxID=1624 RepID=UPI00263BE6B9|nr:BppU family phage baseplate upper protein [Ligilactobacillus salivarius]MDN4848269.1 BppU family phage baseplate upper protein [Ligilactobacillus salivarius]